MPRPVYDPKGTLGTYQTSAEQFPNPEGIRLFEGYGAAESDLERGFCEPGIAERPDYDKVNYELRSTVAKKVDEDFDNTSVLPDDIEFRSRNIRSRGFLTRPRIPTER